MATNPFQDFISGETLGSQPKLSYMAKLGSQRPKDFDQTEEAKRQEEMFGSPFGTSPASKRYFQGQFQNVYNEFLGQQGRALQGGQMPAQNFQQFLQAFPFTQRYSSLPPEMTGRTLGSFAPRVQYSYL